MHEDRETIEEALETAVDRTREAEQRFIEEPRGTPKAVERAYDVEQRAEEVEELATDARERSDDLD